MNELRNKVSEWLTKNEYPLEMLVAQRLHRAGFGVVQSEYYEDPESGKWRETDVIAYEHHRGNTCRAVFSLVVECKSGKDKPWVLFTARDPYPEQLSVLRRASTEAGQSVLNPHSRDIIRCWLEEDKPTLHKLLSAIPCKVRPSLVSHLFLCHAAS